MSGDSDRPASGPHRHPVDKPAVEQAVRTILAAVGEGGTAQIKAFFDGKTQLYEEPLY